jgi:hypothetical protein
MSRSERPTSKAQSEIKDDYFNPAYQKFARNSQGAMNSQGMQVIEQV